MLLPSSLIRNMHWIKMISSITLARTVWQIWWTNFIHSSWLQRIYWNNIGLKLIGLCVAGEGYACCIRRGLLESKSLLHKFFLSFSSPMQWWLGTSAINTIHWWYLYLTYCTFGKLFGRNILILTKAYCMNLLYFIEWSM